MAKTASNTEHDVFHEWPQASAGDFLDVFHPLHVFWEPEPLNWIFRGHARSSWTLVPKALREDTDLDEFGVSARPDGDPPSWVYRRAVDADLLERFHRALDEAGLPIPIPHTAIRQAEEAIQFSSDTQEKDLPLLALAQHFGLPTRLLDWTRHPTKAAYFAAAGTMSVVSDDSIAVWALRADLLKELDNPPGAAHVRFVTAPAASNPNLHAQSGVFTYSRGADAVAVEEFLKAARRDKAGLERKIPFPWLRKITLIRAEAPKLLRLLSYSGINGSSMFPGYDGVVKRMREEAFWKRG